MGGSIVGLYFGIHRSIKAKGQILSPGVPDYSYGTQKSADYALKLA